jgi:hypothetical protein
MDKIYSWKTEKGILVRRELRVQTRGVLIEAKKKWLGQRGYDLQRSDLRMMIRQWM